MVARPVSQLVGRQLPVNPVVNRLAAWFESSANSSAGIKNQPRLSSGRRPLAVPLPLTVRKLLSFSMNRVLLVTKPSEASTSNLGETLACTLPRTPYFSSALGRSWLSGTLPTALRIESSSSLGSRNGPFSFSYEPEI